MGRIVGRYEGDKVMIRVALGMFLMNQSELLKITDRQEMCACSTLILLSCLSGTVAE
jgi:hypothetical protein